MTNSGFNEMVAHTWAKPRLKTHLQTCTNLNGFKQPHKLHISDAVVKGPVFQIPFKHWDLTECLD